MRIAVKLVNSDASFYLIHRKILKPAKSKLFLGPLIFSKRSMALVPLPIYFCCRYADVCFKNYEEEEEKLGAVHQ